jgi:hypothetical protein
LPPAEKKKAFMKSFGAKGRQLLAELEKIDDSPDLFDLPSA